MSQTSVLPAVERRRHGPAFVDTDVHEMLHSTTDLLPYLDEAFHDYVVHNPDWRGTQSLVSYLNPHGGTLRRDARPAGGGPAGSDYDLMRQQLLDRYDVRYAVLGGFFYPSLMRTQPELAAALASGYNDWLIDRWLRRDPRLRGSVQVAAQDPEQAAREIDRVGGHPQMVQVMLPVGTLAYGEKRYQPIFAAADRNGLVVAMHPGPTMASALGLMPYQIGWNVTYPQTAMTEVVSLICSGVFDRFPTLRVLLLEFGFTWVPHLMWRFDQHYASMRSEIPWVKRRPSEYMRENMLWGTQPVEPLSAQHLIQIIDMMGTDRCLVFATDYPHWNFDAPERALPASLPAELRDRLFLRNALDLYGLPDASGEPPA